MIGTILRHRYKIIQKLGGGGIGETYLAEDLNIPVTPKPRWVVKRLHPQMMHPEIQRLFEKEAAILYKLGQKHDRIPKLSEFFQVNGEFYLIQEFIDGQDLSKEITPGKQMSEVYVVKLLQDILEVLALVHESNVIHRDIKPANIMRRRQDGNLMLIDFGIVKEVGTLVVNASGLTSRTITVGTPGYMPSEQAFGKPKLSSDIYAMGMMALEALTGMPPHLLPEDNDGEVVWRNTVSVSDALAEILTKMVRYDFRQRYSNAAEALQALTQLRGVLKPVCIGSEWGYIDNTGRVVIPLQFDKAESFSEGLAVVRIGRKSIGSFDGNHGYIDNTGRVVIPLQFDWAWSFSEGLAVVKIGGKYDYIDKTGRVVIQPQFDGADSFSEGLAAVSIGGKWGYIDKTGQVVIQPQFKWAHSFSEGLAAVSIGGKWGYIDKTGQVVIQPQFDEPESFSEGLAGVRISRKYGYIDKTGQVVIQPQFNWAHSFSEGLAEVEISRKCGYIDKTGRVVIPLQFKWAHSFSEGLAAVEIGGKCGYIDKTGRIVIPLQFDGAHSFSEGLAKVQIGGFHGKWGYIDKTGRIVIEPQFDIPLFF